MPLIYEFELNAEERKRAQDIQANMLEKMLGGTLNSDDSWDKHFSAYGDEIREIYEKGRERTLKHYSEKPEGLYKALEAEIKRHVAFICSIDKSRNDTKRKPLNIDECRKSFEDRIAPYMEILKGYDAEQCEKLSAFIQYAFEHREEIFKKAQKALKKAGQEEILKPFLLDAGNIPALLLMFDGKATQALGRARSNGTFDVFSKQIKISNGVNIFLPSSVHKIGVGTAKLFRYASITFTKLNSENVKGEKLKLRFSLNVKEYALMNGVDINSEDSMKNFRRKIGKDLKTLKECGPDWTEKVKGQEKRYAGLNYIGWYDMKGNVIEIEFTLKMGEYLTSLPLLTYPTSLYRIEDREFNAFAIGEAMCLHYSQNNNVIKGTEGKLRIETLLAYTSFPTYEELKENKWSWEEKVKEPFERALDILTQCGFLKSCEYCLEAGMKISDEEMRAGIIDSYQKFIPLIIKYELNDFPSHEVRLAEITQKKAAQFAKIKASRKKNDKKADDKPSNK